MCVCVHVCLCVAEPVTVELRCHATALILVIGKAQFRRAMLSCDSSCFQLELNGGYSCAVMASTPITAFDGEI